MKAEVRLRKTSTFEPDFEGKNGGWVVGYNYHLEELVARMLANNYGEPWYATQQGKTLKGLLKENRADWLVFWSGSGNNLISQT